MTPSAWLAERRVRSVVCEKLAARLSCPDAPGPRQTHTHAGSPRNAAIRVDGLVACQDEADAREDGRFAQMAVRNSLSTPRLHIITRAQAARSATAKPPVPTQRNDSAVPAGSRDSLCGVRRSQCWWRAELAQRHVRRAL